MAQASPIEWTDATWNPIRGCSRVSEGCRNCYAEGIAARFSKPGQPYEGLARFVDGDARWTGKLRVMHGKDMIAPLRWKKPRRIFVNSMSDLFHEGVADDDLDQIFTVMALSPQHTFQVLTKRPQRAYDYITGIRQDFRGDDRSRITRAVNAVFKTDARLNWGYCGSTGTHITTARFDRVAAREPGMLRARDDGLVERLWYVDGNEEWHACAPEYSKRALEGWGVHREEFSWSLKAWPLPNLWLGVSVEDQAAADARIPLLLETPAYVRFLSCEPLLGPVDLSGWLWGPSEPCEDCPQDEDCACGWITRKDNLEEAIDWVICGGESEHGARPMHPTWARSLRDQCTGAGVPFFFKQWGAWLPDRPLENLEPRGVIMRPDGSMPSLADMPAMTAGTFDFADYQHFAFVGKRKAGRELDGRTWDELPKAAA